MKVVDHLARADRCLFSFEILPPKKGQGVHELFQTVEELLPFSPAFIDVTAHATSIDYREVGGGMLKRVPLQKRPGTHGLCAAIRYRYGVDTVPHLLCSGFSRDETEDALIELGFLGIDTVMALRGDPVHGEKRFLPREDGHSNAHELVAQISAMNRGEYLHDAESAPTDFCIGVAGYPEKHAESPNLEVDLARLKAKVDAGADFLVTQMFFDNAVYFGFVERCRRAGITVPIIPGLKPVTTKAHLVSLPATFNIDLPTDLAEAVEKAPTPAAVRKIGIDWSVEQSRGLIAGGAPCLHYYTMSRAQSIREIVAAVFG
ncbi:MAG: methylenetetrahydrofolate reductase [NAD(P)H] [Fimbriimonadaceae bacterium]|nr:methylenetetrahydrofolate reductase [NAD(P)H] [Fimbriimonadaceae bacterium]